MNLNWRLGLANLVLKSEVVRLKARVKYEQKCRDYWRWKFLGR
jgi:hypothetical protein